MIIYENTKFGFLNDVFKNDIESIILSTYAHRTGGRVGRSEINSWKESLSAIAKVINTDEIPDSTGVAVEYKLPSGGQRIDFMLSGTDESDNDNVVVVELKQWSSADKTEKDGIVLAQYGGMKREVPHPSYQAWSYCELLNNFNEAVYEGNIKLSPCAYLHNYDADSALTDPFYKDLTDRAPLFLKGQDEREKLRSFLKKHVQKGDRKKLIFLIEGGRIRPSKQLADAIVGMVRGNSEFVLIDDQKLVYEHALSLARLAANPKKPKQVLIVRGGPGTGKSVVAINLLSALTKMRLTTKYVSKNAAPRAVFKAKLTGVMSNTAISNLFSGSGAFTEEKHDCFDALIVDEAHRLNERSGLYSNLGENQIKEIIQSARLSVFFIDEDQRVTFKDIGEVSEIRRWARASGATVTEQELSSQFRCNGSNSYLAWLDNTLQVKPTQNQQLSTEEFDFRVMDSPQEVLDIIREKNLQRNQARMVAGYCWDWNSKKNASLMDVEIPEFNFSMQWNLAQDGSLWIMKPESVNQIGCIHTCQGLELDYVGVVVGPDFTVKQGEVVTQPTKRSKQDQSIKGYKALQSKDPDSANAKADLIIKNTYRTLMTRGMKGCYVYFVDAEAAEFFKSRLQPRLLVVNEEVIASNTSALNEVMDNSNVLPFRRMNRNEVKPFENSVPLVDLKIAAGTFSPFQSFDENSHNWVELPDTFRPQKGLFIAQVLGESMNRRIPNRAWCLFRMHPKGSRQGKVVVAQHRSISDPESGGSFTVKIYESRKIDEGDAEPLTQQILLKPDSTDPTYQPLVFNDDSDGEVAVIAEFVCCL